MHDIFADLLQILSEEELIRLGRRAEMNSKLSLATVLKTEQRNREETLIEQLRKRPCSLSEWQQNTIPRAGEH